MARFFQHIEDGENQGKVTRLLYIDDISDDEMTLYHFADGTYCNSEYIGKYDVSDVIKANCSMVELTSPTNKWKFEKHIVLPEESPQMVADDGQLYEALLPGTKTNGGAGSTNGEVVEEQRSGTRIDVKPPKIPSKFTPEDEDNYFLSLHPELENGEVTAVDNNQSPNLSNVFHTSDNSPVVDLPEPVENRPVMQNTQFKFDDEPVNNVGVSTPVMTTLSINSDQLISSGNKEITITVNGKTETISTEEFAKRLSVSSEEYEKVKTSRNATALSEEDVLIKNMIEKSKRKKCAITMRVNYELPPKEVYDTIKSVYEEGLAEQFVKGLALRMPYDKLIASFASGLAGYYDNTLVKKESSKVKLTESEA